MRKSAIATLIALFILIISCQRDDICVEPITPYLVIRFYDTDNPNTFRNVNGLTVKAAGKGIFESYDNVTTDSIALQLDPAENFTTYHLTSENGEDVITIDYLRNEVFVSRSCGYKYNYSELDLSNVSNNWIDNTEITQENVTDETEHIKIYH
ncbi:DUF6452 family protein [Urechidicola vernalis]|uniref:DUF6452 family protein n=1 Tax=Urechidicola vernalis TaxID=3075600 RepID=A0ABU2Y202_9FLAO|nr:DUF6452 family protein [Urechidicola sp. P050]MDT0552233.1 DUF6452 family protein [Urechidicola sp. P050]